jgi:hypothetical protein
MAASWEGATLVSQTGEVLLGAAQALTTVRATCRRQDGREGQTGHHQELPHGRAHAARVNDRLDWHEQPTDAEGLRSGRTSTKRSCASMGRFKAGGDSRPRMARAAAPSTPAGGAPT